MFWKQKVNEPSVAVEISKSFDLSLCYAEVTIDYWKDSFITLGAPKRKNKSDEISMSNSKWI